jgi:hypothetical protein
MSIALKGFCSYITDVHIRALLYCAVLRCRRPCFGLIYFDDSPNVTSCQRINYCRTHFEWQNPGGPNM